MSDDGLVVATLAVHDLGIPSIVCLAQSSTFGRVQASDKRPLPGLIVTLLPRLAIVPQFDLALGSLFFVKSDPCNARLKKRDCERQRNPLTTLLHSLQHHSIQLTLLERNRGRYEGIR